MEEDTLEAYKATILSRYDTLEESDKATLRGMQGTQEGLVLEKLLGPEMEEIGMAIEGRTAPTELPVRRGLATR
jgi:hypothetical protein